MGNTMWILISQRGSIKMRQILFVLMFIPLSITLSAYGQSASVSCTPLMLPERGVREIHWLSDHVVAFDNMNGQAIGDLFRPYYRWYTYNVLTDTLSVFSEWELPPGEIPRELVGTPARSPSPFAAMPLPPELVGVIPHSEQTMKDIYYLSNDRAIIFPRDEAEGGVAYWLYDRFSHDQFLLGISAYASGGLRAIWSSDKDRAVVGQGNDDSMYSYHTVTSVYLIDLSIRPVRVTALDTLPEWRTVGLDINGFQIAGFSPRGNYIFVYPTPPPLGFGMHLFNISTGQWMPSEMISSLNSIWLNNDEFINRVPEGLVRFDMRTNSRHILAVNEQLFEQYDQGRRYVPSWSPTWEYYFARWSMPRRADQHLEDIGYVVCRVPWVNAAITTTPTLSRPAAGQTVRATLMHAGTVTTADPRTIGADGRITLPRIPYGAYTLWLKHAQHLGVSRAVTVDAPSVDAPFPPLRTGDVNDDNRVTLADFSILSAAFGAAAGAPAFDLRADLNGDGAVSISDYTLLAGNYGQVGVPDPSAPEGVAARAVADPAPAELRVTPASVRVGQTVTLTVRAGREGESIDGAGVRLRFDPARFAVESVTAGRNFDRTLLLTWDNAAGTVDAALGRLGGRVGGRFTLLTVRLRALSAGESAVTVEDGLVTTAGSVTPLAGSVTLTVR
jgi:hypothetical protein